MRSIIRGRWLEYYVSIFILLFYNRKVCLLLLFFNVVMLKNILHNIHCYYYEKVITQHNAGFFSCCSVKLVEILRYIYYMQKEPKIVDSSKLFIMYKKNINDDIFDFFEHYNNTTNINIKDATLSYDAWTQFTKYSEMDYKFVKSIIKKYFSPSNKINKIISDIEQKYNIKHNNTLAVYYRGTDKYKETQLSPFGEFYEQIIGLVNKNKNIKILLQSDCARFIDYITNKKIKNIFIIEENNTSYTHKGIHYEQTSDENYYDMLNFLSTIIIMSMCKYIICSSGNCSVWMMLYRGNSKNVIQYLNGNWHNSIV